MKIQIKDKLIRTNFFVKESHIAKLETLKTKTGHSMGKLVRMAIDNLMEGNK